jgi:hypothetical protein
VLTDSHSGNEIQVRTKIMQYVIKSESGISGTCNLGDGPTEKAAWLDAFGPVPWTDYTKRCAKNAWCIQVESDAPVNYDGNH